MGNDCCAANEEQRLKMAGEPKREGSQHMGKMNVFSNNKLIPTEDDGHTISTDHSRMKEKSKPDTDSRFVLDDRVLALKIKY